MLIITENDIIALTVLRDARFTHSAEKNESRFPALVHTLLNRAKASGVTPKSAATEVGVFKMWTRDDPKHQATLAARSNNLPVWTQMTRIVEGCRSGSVADPTNGATAYHDAGISPRWADSMTKVHETDTHVFMK